MAARPRILTIMGSGETSPTMVKTHRAILERVGGPAVLLDTPYGFQENAAELSAKAAQYFRESVGSELGVASLRSADGASALEVETAVMRVREAAYVFAGPGSPTYALRQWQATPIPSVLSAKLAEGGGGAITFASAAALTLGVVTVPVYEIYKVGADVVWAEGLDLLAAAGLQAAVIPHFNNAEGGTHDTRFCYLGERRLEVLEARLPTGAFVLGVDEHTGCILDLDAETATVVGNGVVTIRRAGQVTELPSGSEVSLAVLRGEGAVTTSPATTRVPSPPAESPLLDDVARLDADFAGALAARDAGHAVGVLLELEAVVAQWSTETFSGDEMARARAVLRSMTVRLGEASACGFVDRAELIGSYVEAALAARTELRRAGQFAAADAVRDRLVAAGLEINDTPGGTTWRTEA